MRLAVLGEARKSYEDTNNYKPCMADASQDDLLTDMSKLHKVVAKVDQ